MNEQLRAEYEKYLDRYGLKPRRLPSKEVREAGEREITRLMYEEAISRDDPMADHILSHYEKNRSRSLAETRHPATIAIERAAAEVEATIRALPAFAGKFHDTVFVGEFPTGSINCQAVKVDGGFLVLINSGTIMMLQQVVTFLWRGDANDPSSLATLEAADGVAEVLASYVQDGDPFYGPKPVLGGIRAVVSGSMDAAALKFVIAHEYGHILAGHLAEPYPTSLVLETPVGAIDVVGQNHAQELEADDIGYRLTLGVVANDDFDLATIDAGEGSHDHDALHAGLRLKCLIAAPFVPLTVDAILGKFVDAAEALGRRASRDTHPPAVERIQRLLAKRPGSSPRHYGFINVPFMLLPSIDRIVGVMTDRVFGPPRRTEPEIGTSVREREWFDDIMRCVDAIRRPDEAAAALTVTEAFERARTVFELDVDVVRRELVRASLGQQTTNIGQTLLRRHSEQRSMEQFFESTGRRMRHADLEVQEQPKGLGLVKTVIKEETSRRQSVGAEWHLLNAIVCAWRGEREGALSWFEAALGGGVNDPDGRLARFVALEKKALQLNVQLDVMKLLFAIGVKAAGEKGSARELAELAKAYIEYLGLPLGPLAQRMIDAQMTGDA